MIINFHYSLGEVVQIKALGCPAIVDQMAVTESGLLYRIAYWYDCKRAVEWVRKEEIKK